MAEWFEDRYIVIPEHIIVERMGLRKPSFQPKCFWVKEMAWVAKRSPLAHRYICLDVILSVPNTHLDVYITLLTPAGT